MSNLDFGVHRLARVDSDHFVNVESSDSAIADKLEKAHGPEGAMQWVAICEAVLCPCSSG